MKKVLSLALLIVLFTNIKAQLTQTIRGKVFDIDTQEPLFGANIVIKTLDPIQGTTTDFDGDFTLEKISVGRHTIQVTYLGYQTKTLPNLELNASKQLVLNIGIQESVITSDDIIVTGRKRKGEAINKMTTVSAQEFTVEQAERYAGALNDVARMAQNYAGVQGSDDSRNDIVVRGNSPAGVLYRLDGVDIPNPNHFASLGTAGGPVSILNTNVLGNSDFMTSAFPAEYSNALSGVFDIHLRNGNNQKHEFLGQISFNGFEAGAEGPISKKHKFSYLINYRYSTLGLMKALGVSFGTGAAVPNYQDLFFRFNFPYKKGSVSFWGTGGLSDISFLDSEKDEEDVDLYSGDAEDLRFKSNIGVLGLNHIHRFDKKNYLNTILSFDATQNKTDIDNIDTASLKPQDFYNQVALQGKGALRIIYNHKFNSKHLIQAGLNNQLKFYSLGDSVLRENDLNYTVLSNSKGSTLLSQAYVQWQYKINQQLKLNVGLTGQYFALNNTWATEPRIGLKWQAHPKHSLSFGYGYHSKLQPLYLYFKETQNAQNEKEFLNRNLGFTKSHHLVLAYNWDFLKNTHLKTELYFQYLENVPVESRASSFSVLNFGSDFGEFFPDTLVNEGTGYNYGIEITIEKYLDKGWYFLSTSSLYQSRYKGSDGIERSTAFNGNYTFNLLGGKEFYMFPKKENKKIDLSFLVDAKLTLNGGNRYIPVDVIASKLAGQQVLNFDEAYERKHPDYFRADINIGFKMSFKGLTNKLVFTIQNVSNRKNIFSQSFNASTGKLEYNYQRGLFPMVSYQISF